MSVTLVHQLNKSSLDRLEFVLKCLLILGVSKWRNFLDEKPNFLRTCFVKQFSQQEFAARLLFPFELVFQGAKFSKVFINDFLFQLMT